MALGAFTIVEQVAAQGPVKFVRATIVGDSAYTAGGTTGLLAKLQAAMGETVNIISVQPEDNNGDSHVEYVHATDKLFVRVMSTGIEHGNGDLSGTTYTLLITCY